MEIEREPRDTFNMEEKDFQKPLDISVIGTSDDPCFGKFYEPAVEECHYCGDSEMCAVVHMHNLDNRRDEIEKEQKFKDTEEAVSKTEFMHMTDYVNKIENLLKKKKEVRFNSLVSYFQKKYDPMKLLPPGRLKELTKNAVKISRKLKHFKKGGKVYVGIK